MICLIYLIRLTKKKAHIGKEITKIIFGAIVVITITFNTVRYVIKIKDLNLIDALYVKAIKLKNSLQGG